MRNLFENKLFRIFIVSIIVIFLIIVIAIVIVNGKNKTVTESSLVNAARAYYTKNQNLLPSENYGTAILPLSTLVNNGYVSIEANGSSCPSYVTVVNLNGNYDFIPYIMCDNSSNGTLYNKLTASIVGSGAGLYYINNSYVYKGENPNNYIKIGDAFGRIISIDENNGIRVEIIDTYGTYESWDDRYNKELDENSGINEYIGVEKSRIKEHLDNYFSNSLDAFNSKAIALLKKHSVCVGKINIDNNDIDICSKVIDDQLVSTLTVNDYVNASLDPTCSVKNSKNCQNYNYLNESTWTINACSKNSYTTYVINSYSGLEEYRTSYVNKITPVVSINNNAIYVTGMGTFENPYIIK